MSKIKGVIVLILISLSLIMLCGCNSQNKYEQAKEAFERKNWEEVISITEELLSKKGSENDRGVIELQEQAKKNLKLRNPYRLYQN